MALAVSSSQSFAAPSAQSAPEELAARQAISANVASFSYRDQARWDELRDLFTSDGTISISWYAGPVQGFVELSKEMSKNSKTSTKHLLSAPRITVCGERAISETDATIMVRNDTGPFEVDITSYARFLDTFEHSSDGAWRIRSRVGIYEKDRMDSVGPSVLFAITYPFFPLSRYPRELKHLAYGIERSGLPLAPQIVLSGSDDEQRVKRAAWDWSGCGASSGARLP